MMPTCASCQASATARLAVIQVRDKSFHILTQVQSNLNGRILSVPQRNPIHLPVYVLIKNPCIKLSTPPPPPGAHFAWELAEVTTPY